jgi:uncharacterized protein (TIGR03435 family)
VLNRCSVIGVAALVIPVVVAAQSAPPRLQFEVASIKRHADGDRGGSGRTMPDGTLVRTNQPLIAMLGAAYPSESGEYLNVPDWVRTERYDIIAKPPADTGGLSRASTAYAALQRERWRNLFTDRMKLAVHDETREEAIYELVVARDDRKLGPNLESRPDCIAEAQAARAGGAPAAPPQPRTGPPSESEIMQGCGGLFGPGRMLIGGTTMARFAAQLRGVAGRYVEDKTGLDGWYSIQLRFAQQAPRTNADAGAADPGDAPEIFTALQEQLGLKLQPARKALQVVVVDHIERPTEN